MKKESPLKRRLRMLLAVCFVPLAVMVVYLIITMYRFSDRYDAIGENIAVANKYNIKFKEDIDYIMYIIVVNSERAGELADTERPHVMIDEARGAFRNVYDQTEQEYPRTQLGRILQCLDTLEDRVSEIEQDALVTGYYEKNMERLDVNIRILTELIQEQIQKYIYYQAADLEVVREGIRLDMNRALQIIGIMIVGIIAAALLISRRIMTQITKPIHRLCEMTKMAGRGDFGVRVQEESTDELALLSESFNQMVERIGELVEGIRMEQRNLKATELKLLQAQINPHFLYNTLDAIIWLAEADEKEQVVRMVTSLSDFFRTTLSKGRDYVSLRDEETHIKSYLQIQQFRYRDILEYEIRIPEELYDCCILKLTLQPLVENALYHGLKNKRRLGRILVSAERAGDKVVLRVYDDGKGLTAERLAYVRKLIRGELEDYDSPSGFGLFNVEQRIRLNYGTAYGIELNSVYGEWTEVTVTIPVVKK